MDYKDPIETARAILEGEYEKSLLEEEITEDEFDLSEEDSLEEASKKAANEDDDEDEDEDEDEVSEARSSKKEQDDEEEEDEDEVEEGKLPPWLDKKNGKKNGGDEDEVDEAATDVHDASGKSDHDVTGKGTEGEKKASKKSRMKGAEPKGKGTKGKGGVPEVTPKSGSQGNEGKGQTKEHMEALFDGEELSEEFQTKASTIFEAAIADRVAEIESELQEDHDKIVSESVESISKELTERLDDYLGYVVEEWVTLNELAIERGIRGDIAENFIHGLKGLFESCYVDVPDEKYDLVDGMAEKIDSLETQINEEMEKNISLRKEILEHRCEEVFNETTEGLVDTEVEKLRSLAEGIEFENEEQYKEKLNVLKESYFDKANPESSNYDEAGIADENTTKPIADGVMGKYVSSLSRQLKDK